MLLSSFLRTASASFKPTIRMMPMMSMMTMSRRTFATSAATSDLLEDIKKDHREVEDCYKQYKAAKNVDEAHKWFNQFLWAICRHSVAEEVIVYNMMEAKGDRGKKLAEESREGHRKLKVMLEDLRKEKNEKEFEKKFDAVFQELQDHIKLEEGEDLPFLAENVSAEALQVAAKAFALKKNLVPTRPHPEIPDKPTALELALGMLVYPADKLRDLFTPFPDQKK